MKNLENYGVIHLHSIDLIETEGGFVPLVIWGVAISAKAVAGAVVGAFGAGVGIGAAAYLAGR